MTCAANLKPTFSAFCALPKPSFRTCASAAAAASLMTSSVAGLLTPPTYGAYSSSKHALEALSNALRLEMFPLTSKLS